ncbi:hypothetical protein [Enterococcus lactis]|uniref:hypothetical protein n=1 Tax=Enterococcus lactis TaxID=357441 RepID=UPI0019CB139E|nr:hypothetical protein [Enterococcus lactis]MBC9705705.1 hypothetical protein [Enterococcus sp.]
MTENKQTEANKKWQEKNREHARYLRNRSTARSFIKKQATAEDLEEIAEIAESRQLIKTVNYSLEKIKELDFLLAKDINKVNYEEKKKLFNDIQNIINYIADEREKLFKSIENDNIIVSLNPVIEQKLTVAIKRLGELLNEI